MDKCYSYIADKYGYNIEFVVAKCYNYVASKSAAILSFYIKIFVARQILLQYLILFE